MLSYLLYGNSYLNPCPTATLVTCMSTLSSTYDSENILISWGTDFGFDVASTTYADIDTAIQTLKNDPAFAGSTYKYSTVKEYECALKKEIKQTSIQL